MSNWTPEQINDLLAIAGVRTPGKVVDEPERIIAALVLDERQQSAALREESRALQARVERAEQRAVVLEGIVEERNVMLVRIDQLQNALKDAEKRADEAEASKATAFAMVREFEVKRRGQHGI